MPKVGGKRKKTKTHNEEEELDSTVPTCKHPLFIINLLFFLIILVFLDILLF